MGLHKLCYYCFYCSYNYLFCVIVDDGSGVIICCVWFNKVSSTEELDQYELGDLISVCGRMNIFREEREINVDVISIFSKPCVYFSC